MKYQPYLFNYNIPAENHVNEWPDKFLSVIAMFSYVSSDGSANVFVKLIEPCLHEITQVKNWQAAAKDIESIAVHHFQKLVNLDKKLEAEAVLRQMNWVEGQENIKTA